MFNFLILKLNIYVKKEFVLTDTVIDPMTFHEFPEKELEENIYNILLVYI